MFKRLMTSILITASLALPATAAHLVVTALEPSAVRVLADGGVGDDNTHWGGEGD